MGWSRLPQSLGESRPIRTASAEKIDMTSKGSAIRNRTPRCSANAGLSQPRHHLQRASSKTWTHHDIGKAQKGKAMQRIGQPEFIDDCMATIASTERPVLLESRLG